MDVFAVNHPSVYKQLGCLIILATVAAASYNDFMYFKHTASCRVVALNDCSLLCLWFSFALQNTQTVSYMALLLCVFLCQWHLFPLFIISPQTCFILLLVFSFLLCPFFTQDFAYSLYGLKLVILTL